MDATNQKSEYSLVEKFLLINPESRISRGQYTGRFFSLIAVIIFLITFGFQYLVWSPELAANSLIIVLAILLYHAFSVISVKRCRDFGQSGIISRIIIGMLFFAPVLHEILPLCFSSVIPEVERKNFGGNFMTTLYDIIGVIGIIGGFSCVILFVFLITLSGTKDTENPYDAINGETRLERRGNAIKWFLFRGKDTWKDKE